MTWDELLERSDLVGGRVRIHFRGEAKVHRGTITGLRKIKVEENDHLEILTTDIEKSIVNTVSGVLEWVPAEEMPITTFNMLDPIRGEARPQFEFTGGWAIIYPKGDWTLQ